jgi:hypothetical protein
VRDEGQHAACVDAWLKRSSRSLSPDLLLRLFEAALLALWRSTKTTLGEVTLTAIAERVLHNAAQKFPLLSALKIDPKVGVDCTALRDGVSAAQTAELLDGVRFVLVEFLTTLGNLTAEILTPELHAELSKVAIPKSARVAKRSRRKPMSRPDIERKVKSS